MLICQHNVCDATFSDLLPTASASLDWQAGWPTALLSGVPPVHAMSNMTSVTGCSSRVKDPCLLQTTEHLQLFTAAQVKGMSSTTLLSA